MNQENEINKQRKKIAEDIVQMTGANIEVVIEVMDCIDAWSDKMMEIPPLPKSCVDILPYIQTGIDDLP